METRWLPEGGYDELSSLCVIVHCTCDWPFHRHQPRGAVDVLDAHGVAGLGTRSRAGTEGGPREGLNHKHPSRSTTIFHQRRARVRPAQTRDHGPAAGIQVPAAVVSSPLRPVPKTQALPAVRRPIARHRCPGQSTRCQHARRADRCTLALSPQCTIIGMRMDLPGCRSLPGLWPLSRSMAASGSRGTGPAWRLIWRGPSLLTLVPRTVG